MYLKTVEVLNIMRDTGIGSFKLGSRIGKVLIHLKTVGGWYTG